MIDEIPKNPDGPLGFSLHLGDLIFRARDRESLNRLVLLTPGEVVPLTITLDPKSNVFKKGHRIRGDVSSGNCPGFDVNPNTGEPLGASRRYVTADNTGYHEVTHPSRVMLPIVANPPSEAEPAHSSVPRNLPPSTR